MNELYFAKLWIQFDGDLWKIHKFIDGTTSVAKLISLYKRIKNHISNFPTIKIRQPSEQWPEEYANEIVQAMRGEIPLGLDLIKDHYKFKREFCR